MTTATLTPDDLLQALPEPIRETIRAQLSAAERSKEQIRQEQQQERLKRWIAFTTEASRHVPLGLDVIPTPIPDDFTADTDHWRIEVRLEGLPPLVLPFWREGTLGDWMPETWHVHDECSGKELASGLTWEAALLLAYQHACRRLSDPTPF